LLVHFQGYFTLFPFRKSNIRTVAGSNLAASLCSKYNSNSVPHLVFRVLIKFTYRQHQQVRTHGFCIWYCHRNILPFVVLSASIPFEIAWYSWLKASAMLKITFHLHHQNSKPIAGIFPLSCVQICKSSAASEPTKYKACLGVAVYSKLISFSPFFKRINNL
jgi:hypothetical protein